MEIKKEYDKVSNKLEEINSEIKRLEKYKTVIKYIQMNKETRKLLTKKSELYKDLKYEEYDSCNHLLVYTKIENDYWEGRTYKHCGCIKCGLDCSIKDENINYMTFDEKINYKYLMNHYLNGKLIDVSCNIYLAHSIYEKIKEQNPDIDDETIIKYFKIELENIEKNRKTLKISKK